MKATKRNLCPKCGRRTDLRRVWCQRCWDVELTRVLNRNGADRARYLGAMDAELSRRI